MQFTRFARTWFFLAVLSISPVNSQSQQGGKDAMGPDVLSREIDRLLAAPVLAPAHVGIHILALEDSTILYDYQGSKLFQPASTLKLVTSSAALSLLPPSTRFTTAMYGVTGPDSMIRGDLTIRGTGDPMFAPEDLDTLLLQLKSRGIRRIGGDLVGDISILDTTMWGSGWMWDDEPGGYQPFLSPLALNRNCVSLAISPAAIMGQTARISIVEPVPFVRLFNRTVTSFDTTLPSLRFERDRATNDIVVTGRVDPLDEPDTTTVSIATPDLFFLRCLSAKLEASGITFTGSIRLDTVSRGTELAVIGHDAASVLPLLNKESDNFAAEQLLRMIAQHAGVRPASAAGGIRQILQWMASFGIDTTRLTIADGSGLSSYSMLSPQQLTQLLAHMYRSEHRFPEFFNSLSVAGVDGTLVRRMRGTHAEGRLHAKTGTVTGVSALSGYVLSSDGSPIAFAIMSSMFPGKAKPIKQVEDAVVELLARTSIRPK